MYIYIFLFLAVPAVPDTEVDEVPVQIQTTHNERRRQQHDPDAITADSMMEPSGRQPPTCKTDFKFKKSNFTNTCFYFAVNERARLLRQELDELAVFRRQMGEVFVVVADVHRGNEEEMQQ